MASRVRDRSGRHADLLRVRQGLRPINPAPDKPPRADAGQSSREDTGADEGERIAKRIARAGLCSRREAERWIAAGRVRLDGRTMTDPATQVTRRSAITVDGAALPDAEPTRLWRYHKPRGLVTSHRDPQGRATVFDRLPKELGHVVSVGRLDIGSEGLLLITNDGGLSRMLERPQNGWLRRYRVRAFGTADASALARLAKGTTIDGVRYGAIQAAVDRKTGRNVWLTMSLAEGRNREVRRVLEHLGLTVNRLIRIAYGPFQLGNLARGEIVEVPRRVLRDQLGTARSDANRRR